jgi:DNA-binding transcriptional LysR family regulator
VRVTASEVIGCEVLPAMFAVFRAQQPGIAIELALTNRHEDLSRRDADVAVRIWCAQPRALIARRIGSTRIGLFAHRDYLAKAGAPSSLADLANHRLIGFDRDDRSFRAAGALAAQLSRDSFGFRCDSDLAHLAALRAGVGIGGCQENSARRSPELTPVLSDLLSFGLEIWLVMHEDVKGTPRVRLLFDHLAAGLTDYVRFDARKPKRSGR